MNNFLQVLSIEITDLRMNQQRSLAALQKSIVQILAMQESLESKLDSIEIRDPTPSTRPNTGDSVSQYTGGSPAQSHGVFSCLFHSISSLFHSEYIDCLSCNGCPRRTPRTSSILNRCIGMLSIEHAGILQPARKRAVLTYRWNVTRSIVITYFFPPWMIKRCFYLLLRLSTYSGLQMSLRIPAMVPRSSEIFIFTITGNLKGIRDTFTKGLATPFDIEILSGFTPLIV